GDDDVVPGATGVDDPLRDALDALRVGDGRAAVLLHDQGHDHSRGRWAGSPTHILRMPPMPGGACDGAGVRVCPRRAHGRALGQGRSTSGSGTISSAVSVSVVVTGPVVRSGADALALSRPPVAANQHPASTIGKPRSSPGVTG